MSETPLHSHYDVVIAGARAAGASTAMLLARRGLSVLAVDPTRRGSDANSTHALMRGAVLQLHRWGLLERIRAGETPTIRTTTFHYADEQVEVAIKPRDGVDGLYAPRRTLLDDVLVAGALEAGAHVVHGRSVVGLLRDSGGRVRGVSVAAADRSLTAVRAGLVIGADGRTSRIARLVDAEVEYATRHAAATIYGYWPRAGVEGYHWHYEPGRGAGVIPTNNGEMCVFVSMPAELFNLERRGGLERLFRHGLEAVAPELADLLRVLPTASGLRAFAGAPGFLRRSAGPGWALVGDAGYFRDPITAHGITDALRDAELLARAASLGSDRALSSYQAERDAQSRGLLDVTDRIAAFDWTLEEVKAMHLELSREMRAEVEAIRDRDAAEAAASGAPDPLLRTA